MVKIADLLPVSESVEVAPGKFLVLHPLSLDEMLKLFMAHQTSFLALYAKGMQSKENPDLAPFLLVAPELVSTMIAYAADAVGQEADVALLPATVQLIALEAIVRLSVPDPKKAKELLSGVMAQLRRLSQKGEQSQTEATPSSSDTTSQVSSSS